MREIKFEYGFDSINGVVKKVYALSEIPNIKDKCDVWGVLPLLYVRQFTGLKDSGGEGRDVFEGDIFDVVFKDCPDGYSIMGRETTVKVIKGVVDFKFSRFVVRFMHPEYKEIVNMNLNSFLENKEKVVIGNIYENEELL